jgi:hypothetical protein
MFCIYACYVLRILSKFLVVLQNLIWLPFFGSPVITISCNLADNPILYVFALLQPANVKSFIDRVINIPLHDIAIPLSGFRWEFNKVTCFRKPSYVYLHLLTFV